MTQSTKAVTLQVLWVTSSSVFSHLTPLCRYLPSLGLALSPCRAFSEPFSVRVGFGSCSEISMFEWPTWSVGLSLFLVFSCPHRWDQREFNLEPTYCSSRWQACFQMLCLVGEITEHKHHSTGKAQGPDFFQDSSGSRMNLPVLDFHSKFVLFLNLRLKLGAFGELWHYL